VTKQKSFITSTSDGETCHTLPWAEAVPHQRSNHQPGYDTG